VLVGKKRREEKEQGRERKLKSERGSCTKKECHYGGER
jgi:hypothetical protein